MTTAVALECEMVGVIGIPGQDSDADSDAEVDQDSDADSDDEVVKKPNRGLSAIAHVCVVDEDLTVLYKTYAKPVNRIVDYRTPYSGIRRMDLVGAPLLTQVVPRLRELLRGHLVVGHSVRTDLGMLGISHPPQSIRDTSELPKFLSQGGSRQKLKDLTWKFLRRRIQQGPHDPTEDACASMSLYLAHWDLPGAAPVITYVCNHCRQPGHISQHCPRVTCFRCRQQGHMQSACASGRTMQTTADVVSEAQRCALS